VFVCLSREEPEPIGEILDRVAPELALGAPERMKVAAQEAYAVDANWKLMLENYLECYRYRTVSAPASASSRASRV
jgi:phenylpropionate dioxygenase-like ring-hydroxylating dioxygenase large terminal subunit